MASGGLVQLFSYDLPFGVAVLIEDTDGIPPSGGITCDQTPSVIWGAATGTPPFLYRWTVVLHASDTFVASGATLNVNQVELPELDVGIYRFQLLITDGEGNDSSVYDLIFWVRNCRDERPLEVREVPPFDLERVIPEDADHIRYLPQWMALHGTQTDPASASLFFQWWIPFLREMRTIVRAEQDLLDQAAINAVPVGVPRLFWHLDTRYRARDAVVVTARASGDPFGVRRSTSTYDFLIAEDPVFVLGEQGELLLRNLSLRTVTVSGAGTSGAAQYRYEIPAEPEGIVADTPVFFTYQGAEYRIKAGSPGIDAEKAVIQLRSPYSGPLVFRYSSLTLQPEVAVSVSGDVYRSPDRADLWNRFDELGVAAGLNRYPDEDNLRFRGRIHSRFVTGLGAHAGAVTQHIAQDLTLVTLKGWDGQSTLALTASGIYGVRRADILGLPEIGTITEELFPTTVRSISGAVAYSGSKQSWLPGAVLLVDGVPADVLRFPALAITDNVVDFGEAVSGAVVANYRFRNYDVAYSGQGFVTQVTPVQGNVASGDYTVLLSRNVRVFTASDPSFMLTTLLNPNGTANGYFRELRTKLLEGSTLHFSRARWGYDAHWLEKDDEKPQVSHLPAVFDVITE